MRKYVWAALAGLAIVAAAGLVRAHGGFVRTHPEGTAPLPRRTTNRPAPSNVSGTTAAMRAVRSRAGHRRI